jgi:hypothetical protein
MVRRRVLGLITMLVAISALLGAPEVEARKHRHQRAASRHWRCHSDKQCKAGTCNDAGQCCTAFSGEVACGAGCCNTLLGNTCCGSGCVDTQSDNGNCGGCGVVCSGGHSCQNGVCACPEATTDCGTECVDTTFDNLNCGACGHACGAGQTCIDSTCRCSSSLDTLCNGQCVYLPADDANCGACGHACGAGLVCIASQCVCSDVGDALCNGTCIDVVSDRNNCNGCGNVCPAGQDCVGARCQAPCGPCEELVNNVCVLKDLAKDTVCNGLCVDTQSDPNNCGGCGTVCPSGVTCTNGNCDLCPPVGSVSFTTCPANDPSGHFIAFCCRQDIVPVCCPSSSGTSYGACCGIDSTCCDGACCPAGTHCCANPRSTNPCLPDGQPCPG